MLVGKLCKRDVVTIRKNESVIEAARRMRDRHVGDLVVVEVDREVPVGVLSDRDLVVGVLAEGLEHPAKVHVGDVLTREFVLAREDEDVTDVLHRMQKNGVRRASIVDHTGALRGIFTLDEILGLLAGDMASVVALVKRQHQHERRG
jgi:CBS domain-containing protein